jgi:endonuclease/exonuclease/phosphatase family metal-dependent hydrolase
MRRLMALFGWFVGISAAEEPLRIVCWNIHHGAGMDGRIDLERVAKVIAAEKPDLVALQEVDKSCTRSGMVDQCAELARLTGMTGHFGRAMDFGGGEYGQAILSKHPVKSVRVHPLPGDGEPRIAFEAVVTWRGMDIRFASTHLDLDAERRLAQAKTLVGLLEKDTRPLVLCGDFNDVPGSPTIAAVSAVFSNMDKAPPALTCPADRPTAEIDFVFLKGFRAVKPLVVLPESVASDHRPLLAEVLRE